MYLFGGISSFELLNAIQQWDSKKGDWKVLKWNLPLKMAKFGVAVDRSDTIYILGGVTEGEGEDSHVLLNTAYRLKAGESHWTKMPSMKSRKTAYEHVPCHEGSFVLLPTGGFAGADSEALMVPQVSGNPLNQFSMLQGNHRL